MASVYPAALDAFSNPSPTSLLNSPSHSTQHGNLNDAVEALEAKVGVDNSAVTTSLDYKIRNLGVIYTADAKTTPADNDLFGLLDSAAAFVLKKLSFLNLKLAIGSYLNPVGTIRHFNVATNPNILLGFGTWAAYGAGKVLVAINASDAEFDTLEETGGSKTMAHIHAGAAHTHPVSGTTATNNDTDAGESGSNDDFAGRIHQHTFSVTSGAASATDTGAASNDNNLQPYIVVYRWVRTA